MRTRSSLAISAIASAIIAVPAEAQGSTLTAISGLAELVGGVGDALGKLTDGVQKMIVAGDKGLSAISARRERAALIELSKLTTGIALNNRVAAIPAIERYLSNPSPFAWSQATASLGDVLVRVDSVLGRLDRERSDLVLQPVYARLHAALYARATLIQSLTNLPAPTSKAELAALRRVLGQHRLLVAQLESARDELNEYARLQGG